MLSDWVADEDLLPEGRTFEMFGEWFDIQPHSMIVDLFLDEAIDYVS